jgi:polyhydroxybutyrate depolymerase
MNLRAIGAIFAILVLVACATGGVRVFPRHPGAQRGQRVPQGNRGADTGAASAQLGTRHTLQVGGVTRYYYFHKPANATEPMPLVILYHGGGGNAGKIESQTGFAQVADRNGFAVAYPEAIDHWNDGRNATANFGDDTRFTSELIDYLARNEGVDRSRVYATGASNGGLMTLRLACERANEIAAFAAVAASFPDNFMSTCKPARPVAILIIHGSEDPLIPEAGATIQGGSRRLGGTVTPLADTVDFWRRSDGCSTQAHADSLPDKSNDGTTVKVTKYQGCRGGEVIFVNIIGGGHTWPDERVQPNRMAGRVTHDIDGTQYVWEFFRAHTLGK